MEWEEVKSGWVYLKKKFLLVSNKWTPKYLVLYKTPVPALAVYEQRSDAKPPYAPILHLDLVTITICPIDGKKPSLGQQILNNISRSGGMASRRTSTINNETSMETQQQPCTFEVIRAGSKTTSSLKLCFAVSNLIERDEWIDNIQMVISDSILAKEKPIPREMEGNPSSMIDHKESFLDKREEDQLALVSFNFNFIRNVQE